MRRLPSLGRTQNLCLAIALTLDLGGLPSGCASHGTAVPQPFPTPGRATSSAAAAGSPALAGAVGIAAEPQAPDAAILPIAPVMPVTSMVAEGIVSSALH